MNINRRGFIRSFVLGVGATLTLGAIGFDKTLQAVGLKKRFKGPFPQWAARFKKFGMGGWLHKVKLNIPEGVEPPFDKSWAGVPYERFSFNPTTRKVVYLFRAPERILARPVTTPTGDYLGKANVPDLYMSCFMGDDSIVACVPVTPYNLRIVHSSISDETYARAWTGYKEGAGRSV